MNRTGDIRPVWSKLKTTDTTLLTGTAGRYLVMTIWLCNTDGSAQTVDLTVTSGGVDYELLENFSIAANSKEIIQAGDWPLLALNEGDVLKGSCAGGNDLVHVAMVRTDIGTPSMGISP
jgi:hypothetical protein